MKISKTPDGQIFIDPFDKFRSPKGKIVGLSIGALVLFLLPAGFIGYRMHKLGLGMSHLATAPADTYEAATYEPKSITEPVSAPEPTPEAPSLDQNAALEDYQAGLYALDGMKTLVSDIHTGYTDGQVEVMVTPYFENQPKATREDLAQNLWRAWVVSTKSQLEPDRASIRLVNSRGKSVGGSGVLKGVYVDD